MQSSSQMSLERTCWVTESKILLFWPLQTLFLIVNYRRTEETSEKMFTIITDLIEVNRFCRLLGFSDSEHLIAELCIYCFQYAHILMILHWQYLNVVSVHGERIKKIKIKICHSRNMIDFDFFLWDVRLCLQSPDIL